MPDSVSARPRSILQPSQSFLDISPEARLDLTERQIREARRLPEPHEVKVYWPKDKLGRRPRIAAIFVDEPPRRGNYLYFRRPTGDRDNGYWYVKMRAEFEDVGDRWSTECRFDELGEAIRVYVNAFAREVEARERRRDPGGRDVAEVLTGFVREQARRVHGSGEPTPQTFVTFTYVLEALYPYLDGWRVGDVGRGFTDGYMIWAKGDAPGGAGLAHNSGRSAVHALRFALESALTTETNGYRALFKLPPEEVARVDPFEAEELLRIEEAGETGRVWDARAGDWRRDPDTGLYVRRKRDVAEAGLPYGRMAHLARLTGGRRTEIARTTWDGADGTARLDPKEGVYYGLLPPKTKKTGKFSGIREIAAVHLPRLMAWRDEARFYGLNGVFHTRARAPIRRFDYGPWDGLLEAAGARPLGFHSVKHAVATHLRVAGVSRMAAAAFLCTNPETLEKYYGRFDADVRRGAVEALASIAPYVAWCADRRMERTLFEAVARMAAGNDNRGPSAA